MYSHPAPDAVFKINAGDSMGRLSPTRSLVEELRLELTNPESTNGDASAEFEMPSDDTDIARIFFEDISSRFFQIFLFDARSFTGTPLVGPKLN